MCDNGYTNYAELYQSQNCDIPETVLYIIHVIGLGLSILTFCMTLLILALRWKIILEKKKIYPKIFVFWSCIQNLVMGIRPLINIVLDSYAWQNLWHLYLINMTAYTAACTVILFVYIELKFLKKADLKKGQKIHAYIHTLYALPVLQLIFYALSPLGSYYGIYDTNVAFWMPTLVIALLIIPPLTIASWFIFVKIKNKQKKVYQNLARRILIMAIVNPVLGMSIGIVAIIAFSNPTFNWIMIEIPWNFYIIFNFILFYLMARKQAKYRQSGSGDSDTKCSTSKTASSESVEQN